MSVSRLRGIARVMLASPRTWHDLRSRLGEFAKPDRPPAFYYDGQRLVGVDPVFQGHFDRFGPQMLIPVMHRPVFVTKNDHRRLKDSFGRVRRSVRLGSVSVTDRMFLDGGGSGHAAVFSRFVQERFPGRTFDHALEWCAGPGYIGFGLLAEGRCRRLSLCDINPDAIACATDTIRRNGLDDRVTAYVGDNLTAIEAKQQFDLIVGNPPWSRTRNVGNNELIASDPDWRIHRGFYESVAAYLKPGGIVCVSAFEPHRRRARLSGVWDERPCPPIEEFTDMIRLAGLELTEVAHPEGADASTSHGAGMWFVVSTKALA